jgi:hypothetical protein
MSFRQVSAPVGIIWGKRRFPLSVNVCCGPVNISSCASVGGPLLRRLPASLGKEDARQHRRESYSKSVQGQGKRGGNRAATDHGPLTLNLEP